MRRHMVIALLAMIFSSFTFAAPVDLSFIAKVEGYLNGLGSYRATIFQRNDQGISQTGRVYMFRDPKARYGKMRIEYDPPVKDLFIVDGKKSYFYDSQAKEVHSFSIDSTPAAFLLQRHIRLTKDLQVINQINEPNGVIKLKIIRRYDPDNGSLILRFSTAPLLKLDGWTVVDPQGIHTEVHLENINIGIDLPPSLFVFPYK